MNDLNKFYNSIAKLLLSGDSECKSLAITYMKSLIPDIPKEKQNLCSSTQRRKGKFLSRRYKPKRKRNR